MIKKLLALLLALTLFGLYSFADVPEATPSPEAETVPEAAEGEEADPQPEATPQPAKGYVLVQTATQLGWLPLPDTDEYTFPLQQTFSDGTECLNVIHLTPDGVYMEDSTCEGHDCVLQGTVTLENRDERILSNMIICLPNGVTLYLFTPEEVLAILQDNG